jgi:hypothetical protein
MRALILGYLLAGCGSLMPAPAPEAAPPPPPPPAKESPAAITADAPMPATFCAPGQQSTPAIEAARTRAWELLRSRSDAVACDVSGYVLAKDEREVTLRSEPAVLAEEAGALPHHASVRVAGTSSGWFLLCGESPAGAEEEEPERARADRGQDDPEAVGWVYGAELATGVRGYETGYAVIYAKPERRLDQAGVVNAGSTVMVLGCRDEFWRVRDQGSEGWLRPADTCADVAGCEPKVPEGAAAR